MDNNAEEQYLKWVNTISKKEELEKEIEAIIDRENSDDTINKIIDSLLEEITIIDEIIPEANKEELEILEEDKKQITEKILVIKNCLTDYKNKCEKEKEFEKFGVSSVLFATNAYGNIMIKNDLKKIKKNCEKKVYLSFIELISQLIDDIKLFISTKQKPIQSDSDQIKGLYEMKDYQARVIYRYAGDSIVIVGATLKKENIDSKYRKFCINAKEQSNKYVEAIEKKEVNIKHLKDQSTKFYEEFIKREGPIK